MLNMSQCQFIWKVMMKGLGIYKILGQDTQCRFGNWEQSGIYSWVECFLRMLGPQGLKLEN